MRGMKPGERAERLLQTASSNILWNQNQYREVVINPIASLGVFNLEYCGISTYGCT